MRYVLLCFLLLGCPPSPGPVTQDAAIVDVEVDTPDASADIDAADDSDGTLTVDAKSPGPCEKAFAHMQALHCPPLVAKGQAPWVEVCRNARAHSVDMHTDCRIKAKNCAAVKSCGG